MTREAPAMKYISGECRKQSRYPETGFEEVGQIGSDAKRADHFPQADVSNRSWTDYEQAASNPLR
jgi:hypothetical protein